MSWQDIVLIVWLSIEGLAQVLRIGSDRKPRTPADAVAQIVAFACIAALAVTG